MNEVNAFAQSFIGEKKSKAIITIIFSYLLISLTSFIALYSNPILVDQDNRVLDANQIKQIKTLDETSLNAIPDLFVKVPEFTSQVRERNWWQAHAQVYSKLKTSKEVEVTFGPQESERVTVSTPDFSSTLMILLPLYLVSGALVGCAIYLLLHSKSESGLILAVTAFISALYYLSCGALSAATLTLQPLLQKLLVYCSYIGSAGFIGVVHLAYIFPRNKLTSPRKKLFLWSLYGYTFLVLLFYFIDWIAYGAALPIVVFWTLVLMAGFIHSLITETHQEIRRQLWIVLILPIISAIIFTFLNVLATTFNSSPIPFVNQSLFALTVVLVLIISLDKIELHKRIEKLSQRLESDPIVTEINQQLTPREREITLLFIQGKRAREIAEELPITYATVRTHTRTIYQKLNVNSEIELVAVATGAANK